MIRMHNGYCRRFVVVIAIAMALSVVTGCGAIRKSAVKSVAEAKAYLAHPVLGPRLGECAEAALLVEGLSAVEIFGSPDDMKLRSCATLFARVSSEGSVFHRILDNYFHGKPDDRTIRLMRA